MRQNRPDALSSMGIFERMQTALEPLLAELIEVLPGHTARLGDAMRYATLGGGKRLRPALVMQSAALFEVEWESVLRTGAAIEMVHCYSLTHDDLPAMDDDALRRGKPTCHREFDEATAILAGDALLTLAFQVLADPLTHDDAAIRSELVLSLAQAAGARGMVGGQVYDLAGERQSLELAEITAMQSMKTGALLVWSCQSGAILGRADAVQRAALLRYGRAIGLAFQLIDDLLDHVGDAAMLGKHVGKDEKAGKASFVLLLGVDAVRAKTRELVEDAKMALGPFAGRADALIDTAEFIISRQH